MHSFRQLLADVHGCTLCKAQLPHGVRPVLQIDPQAKVLIAGQAPGRKVHQSGIPFDDASGDRLREWLGLSRDIFYDPTQIAILPMGFCYPGSSTSGDLPPRVECAPAWRDQLLAHLPNITVTVVIGRYAMAYHFDEKKASLTEMVRNWPHYWPTHIPLPHPSPRNNIWLSRNRWFEKELLPVLRQRMAEVLKL